MEPVITFSTSVDDVDWAELKSALAADYSDNGRTPAEYEASSRRSHAVVFARDGSRIIGNLFTEDMRPFYERLGFQVEHEGMSRVMGTWLNRSGAGA